MNTILDNNLEKTLQNVPWEKESVIKGAMSFLSEYGILSDVHKNNLIIGIHMVSKAIKKTEFFVKPIGMNEKGLILIYLYVERWFYIFGKKKRIADKIINGAKDLCPEYNIAIKYRIFKKRKTK